MKALRLLAGLLPALCLGVFVWATAATAAGAAQLDQSHAFLVAQATPAPAQNTTPTPAPSQNNAGAPAAQAQPAPAAPAGPPACSSTVTTKCTPNSGDTAWMLTSVALVLMMTVPGLGLFYGGMVRKKNVGDTVMTSFAIC